MPKRSFVQNFPLHFAAEIAPCISSTEESFCCTPDGSSYSYYIPIEFKCNGINDCNGGEDEDPAMCYGSKLKFSSNNSTATGNFCLPVNLAWGLNR